MSKKPEITIAIKVNVRILAALARHYADIGVIIANKTGLVKRAFNDHLQALAAAGHLDVSVISQEEAETVLDQFTNETGDTDLLTLLERPQNSATSEQAKRLLSDSKK